MVNPPNVHAGRVADLQWYVLTPASGGQKEEPMVRQPRTVLRLLRLHRGEAEGVSLFGRAVATVPLAG